MPYIWHLYMHIISQEDVLKLKKPSTCCSTAKQCQQRNEWETKMFAHQNKQMDRIPPTREALIQHLLRATYQSGHLLGQMQVKNPLLPSPSEWGWMRNEFDEWTPHWSHLTESYLSCRELMKWICRTSSRGGCKCLKENFPCTQKCYCGGVCDLYLTT